MMSIRGPVLVLYFPTSHQAENNKALTFVDDTLKPWHKRQLQNRPLSNTQLGRASGLAGLTDDAEKPTGNCSAGDGT